MIVRLSSSSPDDDKLRNIKTRVSLDKSKGKQTNEKRQDETESAIPKLDFRATIPIFIFELAFSRRSNSKRLARYCAHAEASSTIRADILFSDLMFKLSHWHRARAHVYARVWTHRYTYTQLSRVQSGGHEPFLSRARINRFIYLR